MTYVVTEACVRCKFTNCVEVCPVDCFFAGDAMLVIDPDVCIDCGVCEPECPADAIKPDTTPEAAAWVIFNRDMSRQWPNITEKTDPPADADGWLGVEGKFEQVFGTPAPAPATAAD